METTEFKSQERGGGVIGEVKSTDTSVINCPEGRFASFLSAMRGAFGAGVPFVAVSRPGEDVRFLCDAGGQSVLSDERFIAVPWLEDFGHGVIIRDTLTPVEASELQPDDFSPTEMTAEFKSTDKDAYLAGITRVVSDLRKSGGKTVIATVITGDTDFSPLDFAVSYLDGASRESYRCVFYTPGTGMWVLASPEVLLDVNTRTGEVYTMSLAGTRTAGSGDEWDDKNIKEQSMVTGFITECLVKNGCSGLTLKKGTRRSANVEHIITHISGAIGERTDIHRLLDAMSPTPALCGLPREVSIERIARTESFPRRMYGGYTALENDGRFYSAVTLRCICFDDRGWCIYAGGGITAASVPESEWRETRMKAAPLIEALARYSSKILPPENESGDTGRFQPNTDSAIAPVTILS